MFLKLEMKVPFDDDTGEARMTIVINNDGDAVLHILEIPPKAEVAGTVYPVGGTLVDGNRLPEKLATGQPYDEVVASIKIFGTNSLGGL